MDEGKRPRLFDSEDSGGQVRILDAFDCPMPGTATGWRPSNCRNSGSAKKTRLKLAPEGCACVEQPPTETEAWRIHGQNFRRRVIG